MQFSKLRGAVSAALLFVGLCGAAPSTAWAQSPVAAKMASAAAPVAAAVVATASPAAAVATTAMSGSAWIAQGTVLAPGATQPAAAPTGAIPLSMVPHAASLMELVGDMPLESDLTPDLKCLAQAVYFESRGEPIEGQLAVAEVVINRAKSGQYPADYCDVITQPAQFSFVHHGVIPTADETSSAWQRAKAIAEIAQQNLWRTKAADALYFHATYVNPSWAHQKVQLVQIDTHIFYR